MTISTDILLTDITNDNETGVFDVLMSAVNKHINDQYQEGRITSGDYGNVYLGSIQAVLQQAIQYTLQEKVNEAQIESIAKDNELKDQELLLKEIDLDIKKQESDIKAQELEIVKTQNSLERAKTLATIDKEFGFDYTIDGVTNEIIIGADTGDGKIDVEIAAINKDIDVKERSTVLQEEMSLVDMAYKEKQKELVDSQIIGSGYDNQVKEEQVIMSQYERTEIQPAKLADLEKDTEIKERQTIEQELTGIKQRGMIDVEQKLAEQKIVGKKQNTIISE